MKTLMDNSTVTAALRAAGFISNRSPELFELDVAALRVLVDGIILSDELFILDTYKAEHTPERKSWLSNGAIIFKEMPEKLDKSMIKNAQAHVYNWHIAEHLATDLEGIFNDLSIMFRHAWRNSEAFLVLKSFGLENKYNSMITKALRKHFAERMLRGRGFDNFG